MVIQSSLCTTPIDMGGGLVLRRILLGLSTKRWTTGHQDDFRWTLEKTQRLPRIGDFLTNLAMVMSRLHVKRKVTTKLRKHSNYKRIAMVNTQLEVGTIVIICNSKSKHNSQFGFVYKRHASGRFGVKLSGGQMVLYSLCSLRKSSLSTPESSPWKEDFERVCEDRDNYFLDPCNVFNDTESQTSPSNETPEYEALQHVIERLSQQLSQFSIETVSRFNQVQQNVQELHDRQETLSEVVSRLRPITTNAPGEATTNTNRRNQPNTDIVPMDH